MKTNKYFYVVLSFALLFLAGCGQKEEKGSPAVEATSVESSNPTANASSVVEGEVGSLRGKVLYEGAVPAPEVLPMGGNPECAALHPEGKVYSETLLSKDGKLQNAFVYIKEGLEGKSFPVSNTPARLENKNCLYVPHVLGVQVGQPVELLNEDATLHNVHSYSKNNKSWNLGLPFQGMKQTKKFEAAEIMVNLKCDVHPWMVGYVGVVAHPFFAVTGENGEFELKDVPAGEYTIEVWHEKLGAQTQKIQVGPQETKEIDFKFSA